MVRLIALALTEQPAGYDLKLEEREPTTWTYCGRLTLQGSSRKARRTQAGFVQALVAAGVEASTLDTGEIRVTDLNPFGARFKIIKSFGQLCHSAASTAFTMQEREQQVHFYPVQDGRWRLAAKGVQGRKLDLILAKLKKHRLARDGWVVGQQEIEFLPPKSSDVVPDLFTICEMVANP